MGVGDIQYPDPALEQLIILQGRDYKAVQAPGSGEFTLSHKPERCENSEDAGLVTEVFFFWRQQPYSRALAAKSVWTNSSIWDTPSRHAGNSKTFWLVTSNPTGWNPQEEKLRKMLTKREIESQEYQRTYLHTHPMPPMQGKRVLSSCLALACTWMQKESGTEASERNGLQLGKEALSL